MRFRRRGRAGRRSFARGGRRRGFRSRRRGRVGLRLRIGNRM